MANTDLSEQTTAALESKSKSLGSALAVMGVLCLLYAGFYVYLFATDNFVQERHLLGVVPLVGLLVIAATTASGRKTINQEIRKRQAD